MAFGFSLKKFLRETKIILNWKNKDTVISMIKHSLGFHIYTNIKKFEK